jgi:hypothetical protein
MKVSDLDFGPHLAGLGGTQAKVEFPNGYGASIVVGERFYSRPGHPYEIAVLDKDGITYETHITDDVCGYLTEDEANDILAQIEALPKVESDSPEDPR